MVDIRGKDWGPQLCVPCCTYTRQGSSLTVACAGNDHIPSLLGSFLPSPCTLMSSEMWFATQLSEAQRAFVGSDGQSWTVSSPQFSL